MKVIMTLSVVAGLAACTQTKTTNDEALLASIIRQNGCEISKPEAESLLAPNGLSPAFVEQVTSRWIDEGLATTSSDPQQLTLFLGTELCEAP